MSTSEQEDSIDRQRSQVLPCCERKGYRVVAEYADEGIAGDEFAKRTGLQRLLADAKAGKFDVVVVDEVSRLSRQKFTEFMGRVAMPLDEAGVTVDSVNEGPLGWDEIVDVIKLSIYQPTARGESKKISSHVLTGMANLARQGRLLGGVPPFGYKVEYQTVELAGRPPKLMPVRLIPDGYKAEVVRWLFERYAAGMTLQAPAVEMNGRAVCRPGRPGRKRPPGEEPPWTRQAVLHILRNPKYTGCLTWNRRHGGKYHRFADGKLAKAERAAGRNGHSDWVVTPDTHEPLVSRELFERVQDKLEGNRGGRVRASRKGYLFSGLLVCSHCGRTLYGVSRYGRMTYRCRMVNDSGQRVCKNYGVGQEKLHRLLIHKLQHAFLEPANLRRLRAELRRQVEEARQPARVDGLRRRIAELERQVEQGRSNLALLPSDMIPGVVAKVREWEAERDRLAAELRQAAEEAPLKGLEELIGKAEEWLWRLKEATAVGDPAVQQAVIREMIVRVELRWTERLAGQRIRYPVAGGVIVYKFGGGEGFRLDRDTSKGAPSAVSRIDG
jgi:DNA invertase Pin-like site-specific DNA recombinase